MQHSNENFFFNRIANVWNSLPNNLVNALRVNSFKADIDFWMCSNQSHWLHSVSCQHTHWVASTALKTTTITSN